MSKFIYQTPIAEEVLSIENLSLAYYETNLPHADYISDKLCNAWNSMNMEQYYDGILKNNIVSSVMKCIENEKGELLLNITFTLKKGIRLTDRYRNAIIDQTSAQMSDGWGESYFGYSNIMTAPDGVRFCVH